MTAETRAHTFDGIEEFDNRLPNWWLWTFYLAVIFSIGYWVYYHTIGTGDLPGEAYLAEQRAAAAAMEQRLKDNPITNETLLELADNPTFVAEGKQLFVSHCALCHRDNGSAYQDKLGWGIGANLTDEWWIYGAEPMDVYQTILKGRQADPEIGSLGGMQAWQHMGMGFVQRTTAFVLSIRNSRAQGGKPPEKYAKKVD